MADALASVSLAQGAPAGVRGAPTLNTLEIRPGLDFADRYRLVRRLGRGGMGSVWLAQHLELQTPCALKFIGTGAGETDDERARFNREARAAASLRSPHVVQVFDHGVWSGVPFIAMELLEGEDLRCRLARRGRLTPDECLVLFGQVVRALGRAHAAGIVHRDLKPDNIFFVRDDDRDLVKILDFGIAKFALPSLDDSDATKTGTVLGSPNYMSPEQARGLRDVDARSDLWSLAVIAFQCLTGLRPFSGGGLIDILHRIVYESPPVPTTSADGVPPGFDAWWARATSHDPAGRFASAREWFDTLCVALDGDTSRYRINAGPLAPGALAGGAAGPVSSPSGPLVPAPVADSPSSPPMPDGGRASTPSGTLLTSADTLFGRRARGAGVTRGLAIAAVGVALIATASALVVFAFDTSSKATRPSTADETPRPWPSGPSAVAGAAEGGASASPTTPGRTPVAPVPADPTEPDAGMAGKSVGGAASARVARPGAASRPALAPPHAAHPPPDRTRPDVGFLASGAPPRLDGSRPLVVASSDEPRAPMNVLTPSRLLLGCLLVLAAVRPAAAGPSAPDLGAARTLAQDGQIALDRRDFATAFDRFGRAAQIFEAPTVLLGLARAQAGLGRFVAARETYSRLAHLSLAPNASALFRRAVELGRVEGASIEPRLASVTLTVNGAPNASVTLDDEPLAAALIGVARPTDPGPHHALARAAGYADADASFFAAEGASVTVPLVLRRDSSVVSPGPSSPRADVPDAPPGAAAPVESRASSTLAFIALGVGGAGVALGAVTGALALQKHSDLRDACPNGACPSVQYAALDRYHALGTLSTVGFVVGAVGVGAGLTLLALRPSPSSPAALTVTGSVGVGALTASARF